MGVHGYDDVVKAARELAGTVDAEIRETQALRVRNSEALGEATRACEAEGLALSRALLPELTPDAVAGVTRLAGPAFLGRTNPVEEREAERQAAAAELSGIEADPRHKDRDLLLADLGEQRREAVDLSAPDRDLVARAAHPRLERLLASNYDTPSYAVGWWHLDYYRDWKAGDEVVEKFPGKSRFAELREPILEGRKTLAVFDAKLADLDGRIGAIDGLVRRAGELRELLPRLDGIHLEKARERVRAYLVEGDQAAIGQRLSADPGMAESFKTLRGLAAKIEYFNKIDGELGTALAQLAELRAKADRDAAKWLRPKHRSQTVSDEDFSRRYLAPREKMRRRRERYGRMTVTIHEYHNYGAVDFSHDALWWDLFTDGRIDGDFIPEVATYHRQNPHSPRMYAAEADAAALEAGGLHGGGAGRGFGDPS